MARVEDVAATIIRRLGRMDSWKLQKLVYYAQAWHLAWRDQPLFAEPIRAWTDGPAVYELFKQHQGKYFVSDIPGGRPEDVPAGGAAVIEFVCRYYGKRTGQYLRELTHKEDPWPITRARAGLADDEPGTPVIPRRLIRDFYRKQTEIMDEAWYWTPEWLAGEHAADDDLQNGRVDEFASDDEFLAAF